MFDRKPTRIETVLVFLFVVSLFLGPSIARYSKESGKKGADQLAVNSISVGGAKHAHKVVPLQVSIEPGGKANVAAMLTFDDGTKAKCEYLAVFNVDEQQPSGIAMTMTPYPGKGRCTPVKSEYSHVQE